MKTYVFSGFPDYNFCFQYLLVKVLMYYNILLFIYNIAFYIHLIPDNFHKILLILNSICIRVHHVDYLKEMS